MTMRDVDMLSPDGLHEACVILLQSQGEEYISKNPVVRQLYLYPMST